MIDELITKTLRAQNEDDELKAALAFQPDDRERKVCCSILKRLLQYLREDSRLRDIVASIQAEIANIEEKLRTPAPRFSILLTILSSLLIIAGVALLVIWRDSTKILLIIAGIGLLVLNICLYRHRKQKWQAFIDGYRKKLEAAQARLKEAQDDVASYREKVLNPYIEVLVPDRFPATYAMNLHAVEIMYVAMRDLRGNSMTDAINLYEEAVYRATEMGMFNNMQNSLASTARSAARSAAANESAAASAAATAASAAATAAATASIANSQRSMAKSAARSADAAEKIAND